MKKIFMSRQFKIVVDILLIAVLILFCVSYDNEEILGSYWKSSHCITGLIWISLILVHVAQHWKFTKMLVMAKVMRRNKITAFTTLFFVILIISIMMMAVTFDVTFIQFHGLPGKLFLLFVVIHIIQKFKKFLLMFKKY